MDDLLIFGGLIMFLVGVVMLVKAFVKKTKKKQALLLIAIGFIVWVVGGAFVETDDLTDKSTIETTITEDNADMPEQASENITDVITSEQDAIDAVKKYAEEQGYSEVYDKFNAIKEENSYFVMAGFSYLGDSWEGSADMFDVNISDGTVALRADYESDTNVLNYENSDFAKLGIDDETWYLEDLENAGSFMPINFNITSEGIETNIELMYGVLKLDVLCVLDSTNHAIGYDDGSGIGGLAKYTGEFEEGTELYIEIMIKDSELYLAMYHEGEACEYQKLLTSKAMDIHGAMMDGVF